jgi:phosphatidylinositol kinase/protein kinase (PI-3  family)
MGLLRENKDTLMTVLDPFIHDPLVEWEDEKRKIVSPEHVGLSLIENMLCPGTTGQLASCSQQVSNRFTDARKVRLGFN